MEIGKVARFIGDKIVYPIVYVVSYIVFLPFLAPYYFYKGFKR